MIWRRCWPCARGLCFDHGEFSEWQAALRAGLEWNPKERDPRPYYDWLEPILFEPGRTAVVYDVPGAPSQFNDGFLNDWPFGRSKGTPVWHMDGPLDRLGRLLDRFDCVCLGWIGEFDPVIGAIRPEQRAVGCDAYHRRMEDVSRFLGNDWPPLHMMRGTLVAQEYPFLRADSTALAQNGWRYDDNLDQRSIFPLARWAGRNAYADRLERGDVRGPLSGNRARYERSRRAQGSRSPDERRPAQLGIW